MAARKTGKNNKNDAGKTDESALPDFRPLPWDGSEPSFHCPELGGDIPPGQMSRHYLILGETGSGKTASIVLPLVRACTLYRADESEHRASMLIIDPKVELIDVVKSSLAKDTESRLFPLTLNKQDYRIDYFEGEGRLTLSANAIIEKLLEFSPTFKRSLDQGGENVMWSKRAQEVVESILGIDLSLRRRGKDFWSFVSNSGSHGFNYKRDNYFDTLQQLVTYSMRLAGSDDPTVEQRSFWRELRNIAERNDVDPQIYDPLSEMGNLYAAAYLSILSLANALLSDLSQPDFTQHVSINPFEGPSNELSVKTAIEEGNILLYTPDTTMPAGINIGKALKSKFFQFTFRRQNKARPVIYACDEFQRFITGDPVSGEQSFLDRCRAYRASCILATQSLSSLHYELKQNDAKGAADLALRVMINNAGNKYFFRNTDTETATAVETLIPAPPVLNKPSIIRARPMSTLKPGECYYLRSDGTWGRKQVQLTKNILND